MGYKQRQQLSVSKEGPHISWGSLKRLTKNIVFLCRFGRAMQRRKRGESFQDEETRDTASIHRITRCSRLCPEDEAW